MTQTKLQLKQVMWLLDDHNKDRDESKGRFECLCTSCQDAGVTLRAADPKLLREAMTEYEESGVLTFAEYLDQQTEFAIDTCQESVWLERLYRGRFEERTPAFLTVYGRFSLLQWSDDIVDLVISNCETAWHYDAKKLDCPYQDQSKTLESKYPIPCFQYHAQYAHNIFRLL